MDDEEETYRLWKIRKTIMQVSAVRACLAVPGEPDTQRPGGCGQGRRTVSAKWRSRTKAGSGAASTAGLLQN